MPDYAYAVLLIVVIIVGWVLGTLAYEYDWQGKLCSHLVWRRKSPYKVGDRLADMFGTPWIIYSISRNQYVLVREGTTIYHAEVRSSIERYYSAWPQDGV